MSGPIRRRPEGAGRPTAVDPRECPASRNGWTGDLEHALTALHRGDHDHAVVQLADGPYYVQLLRDEEMAEPPRALVEAVSNEYLSDEDALRPEQEGALRSLGWQDPGTACDPIELCRLDHPNWFRFVDIEPSGAGRVPLVGLILATLGVFGLREGAPVTVTLGGCSSRPDP